MKAIQSNDNQSTDFLQVRVDGSIKEAFSQVTKTMGISPSQAVKVFMVQTVIHNAIPFDIHGPEEEMEMLSEEEEKEVALAMEQIKNGDFVEIDMSDKKKVKRYFGV